MTPRLVEIQTELDSLMRRMQELHTEQAAIIAGLCDLPGPALEFDEPERTIRWQAGSVKLGPKAFRFVRTIWESKNHRATCEKIERCTWGKRQFVASNTVSGLVRDVRKVLKKAGFPYKIVPVKNFLTLEIKGFTLKSHRMRNFSHEQRGPP